MSLTLLSLATIGTAGTLGVIFGACSAWWLFLFLPMLALIVIAELP